MAAPQNVLALVENFDRHIEDYRRGRKGETEIRVEFIDPFFEALGWDVNNRSGYAEAYKDVVHEDAIKVGGTTKAPDYCFRVGGTRKFFLEAKKPSVDIAKDIGPAYQLRRYAWSAKLPLSILTDFEEFAVYDCRVRPAKTDKASKARVKYLTYTDYAEHWDELAGTFSKQAVLQGSFDKYVHDKKRKKGTAEVDEEFLKEIERWRDHLARNIALRNPHLGVRDVNFAVQRTIDRIIFLRMCEDRGVEAYGRLQGLINGERVYPRLLEFFRAADDRYNSGLFHFNDERDRATSPDTLTPDLDIDDKVLKDIFKNLYYPDSPYEFGVLPADILGNVYEQFLGKVIRLTPAGQAKVEEKPEVKKAGGVYYTPKYIVDYIVKHTVGELIDGKTPIEIGGLTDSWKPSTAKNRRPLTVCDPACGSGSFLIGAYRYLLNYHRDWYVNDGPENHTERIYQGAGGQWYLTTEEKKRILTSCIYGVDIDPQAVEVTKLNLLLAVLENENQQTLGQLNLIHQRVLPDLGNNIKCGNSLIASDFYNGQQLDLFDEEAQYKINAFDWPDEFPHILGQDLPQKQRGFNAVIGNPPYIRIQALKETQPEAVDYFGKHYKSAAKGNYDIYVVFIEKGRSLCTQTGRLGFIIPSKFLTTDYGETIRNLITTSGELNHLVDFGHSLVFAGVSTYTCLLFLDRARQSNRNFELLTCKPTDLPIVDEQMAESRSQFDVNSTWVTGNRDVRELIEKLNSAGPTLSELGITMTRGLSTGADDVFCLHQCEDGTWRNKAGTTVEVEEAATRYEIHATDFERYRFAHRHDKRLIFPYTVETDGYSLLDIDAIKKVWPRTHRYLCEHKKNLLARKQYREWWGFSAPRGLHLHARAQILVPLLAEHGAFSLAPPEGTAYSLMASGGFSLGFGTSDINFRYLLGLLNSKLIFWHLRQHSNRFRGGWITCTKQYFSKLPIKCPPHHGVTELVDRMLGLHKQLGAANTEHGRVMLERQIRATDRDIDALVYELYGLTDDEIAIVEAATE
jgi:type I restriction-modification system DNA methylase subunit